MYLSSVVEPPTRLERYLAIETAGGPSWHPISDRIAYVSNVTGTFQVYTIQVIKQSAVFPLRITYEEDRCTDPRYMHDGSLVFCKDCRGNENFQIGTIAGEEVVWLTSSPEAKHLPTYSSKRGLYYIANLSNSSRLDTYRLNLPLLENEPDLLLEPDEGLVTVRLVSNDEKYAVLDKDIGASQQELMLLDIESRTVMNLTKDLTGERPTRWEAIRFLGREHLLVTTDHNSDFNRLAVLSLSGDVMPIPGLGKPKYEVEHATWVAESEYTYWTYNDEGYSAIYRGRFKTDGVDAVKQVKTPYRWAVVSGDERSFNRSISMSLDARFLALTVSSPTMPTNIWICDVTDGDMWEVSPVSLCGLNSRDFVDCTLHRVKSFDGVSVPYFHYVPLGRMPERGWPAIFMIHGGPESQKRPEFDPVIQFWLCAGFAVVTPNIRGSTGYGKTYLNLDDKDKRLGAIHDIKEIVTHIKQHDYEIDISRLVVFGGSYGGFAVLSAMTEYPEIWKAGVDIVGISNFVTFLQNTAPWRRKLREAEYGSLDHDLETLIRISPIHKVDKIQAPLFIIQGDNDERVPLSESLQIYEKLRLRGIPVKLLRYADEGHGLAKLQNRIDAWTKVLQWLEEVV